MDFVSHAHWGGIAFGKGSKKVFPTAAVIWISPDVLTEGLFVVFTLLFLLIWVFERKSAWIIDARGLHILIDIPTHSIDLFPSPFLWPLSDFKFNGIGWHNPIVLGVNILLPISVYLLWLNRI